MPISLLPCIHLTVSRPFSPRLSSSMPRPGVKKGPCCRWAPICVPLERRLQTAAVLVLMLLFPALILSNLLFVVFWVFLGPPYLIYLLWFIFADRETPQRGGRAPIGRTLRIWKLFRGYFPADLVVEGELSKDHVYLFGVYPHGVIGMATLANMMNDVHGLLANIDYRLVTLKSNFYIPIAREWLLWMGLISSDKKGIVRCLEQHLSVMIVVGGAAEALEIHKDYHGIVLDKRRGFVEIAIRTGAHLVPVFNFGENELFRVATSNEPGTRVRRFQEWMKQVLGFTLPVVHGRGIWNYSFGILPFRRPVTTVCGKPIPVEKAEPTKELIAHYHNLYKTALLDLHNRWRLKVGETTILKVIA